MHKSGKTFTDSRILQKKSRVQNPVGTAKSNAKEPIKMDTVAQLPIFGIAGNEASPVSALRAIFDSFMPILCLEIASEEARLGLPKDATIDV